MATGPEPDPVVAARIRRIEEGLLLERLPWHAEPARAPLAARMAYRNVPAVSVAVINEGRIEWARAYGVRESGQPGPVDTATLFQAGSISKTVTALAVLRLVAQGRLALDEDVHTYLTTWRIPANAGWQPRVTLRQLLSHTAGLTVHGFDGYPRGAPIPALRQVLDGAPPANHGPVWVSRLPGSGFRYAGGGYCVVQQLLIDVGGPSFPDLLRDLVLDPLGMADSTFAQPLPPALWDRAASGHYWVPDDPVAGQWYVFPEQAAAGLWTTAADLARLAVALQQAWAGQPGAILPLELARQMLTPVSEDAGLGIFLDGEGATARFRHDGDTHGFTARLNAYRARGQGLVVLTNSYGGSRLIPELEQTIAAEYAWPDVLPAPPTPVAVDPATTAAFAGEYELEPGAAWVVAQEGDQLTLRPPGQPPLPLYPASATRFFTRAVEAEAVFTPDHAGGPPTLAFTHAGHVFAARRRT